MLRGVARSLGDHQDRGRPGGPRDPDSIRVLRRPQEARRRARGGRDPRGQQVAICPLVKASLEARTPRAADGAQALASSSETACALDFVVLFGIFVV